MSTATIERTLDVRALQLDAAAAVADIDLDDVRLWRRVDGMVAALATVAYNLTAAVTGEAPRAAARSVPPIVRARELASAQRRLFDALDRHPAPAGELVEAANQHVRRIDEQLRSR
jgi:hypothetical protein